MSWKDEYIKTCWELWDNGSKTAEEMFNGIGRYIVALIKEEREEEHKKTWDNIKEIYDTTDYKKHIEEAIKETAIKCKAIGQRTIRNTQEWRDFANEIEKEYNLKIGE